MTTRSHLGTRIALFPLSWVARFLVRSEAGEHHLHMVRLAAKKRARAEYFKRENRRKEKELARANKLKPQEICNRMVRKG